MSTDKGLTASLPTSLTGLSSREAIADVLHRACLALDLNSPSLWESAWLTSDPSICMEISGRPVIKGWANLNAHALALIGPLDTQHNNSGIRIDLREGASTARLTCNALNQHFRAGEGHKPGAAHLLAGSTYDIELTLDGKSEWKMKSWKLNITWAQGDWAVMQPSSS